MNDTATIMPHVVEGKVRVPGSKSVTHRAFLLAAQSAEPSTVLRPLLSADTRATLGVLHALGYQVRPEEGMVRFLPAEPRPPTAALDCRNSGTTLRLTTALAARLPFLSSFTGDASLQARPNAPLLTALADLGAQVHGRDQVPYGVTGPLRPGHVSLPAGTSSQYASGLLLSLPMLAGDSRLSMEPPVASAPYLEVTRRVAEQFGLHWSASGSAAGGLDFMIPGGQRPRCAAYTVEGDWSTAAFPLVAAAITGGRLDVQGLDPDSAQGDRAIIQHLEAFGARVSVGGSVRAEGGELVSPGTIDVAATPDMFPALAVLAANSEGTTTFTGGAALRHKESDRITAMARGLTAMGIQVDEAPDGMTVKGKPGGLQGAVIHAHDDHRIHMAFSVAGLVASGKTVVDGRASAAVSYPSFHEDLAALEVTP